VCVCVCVCVFVCVCVCVCAFVFRVCVVLENIRRKGSVFLNLKYACHSPTPPLPSPTHTCAVARPG
jgi:hypothetical protein